MKMGMLLSAAIWTVIIATLSGCGTTEFYFGTREFNGAADSRTYKTSDEVKK